ncbi:MAG: hypothetical protein GY753_10575, partial [Gammaproteobacteria bacterium]|nr:hypothetical protein [Gammaproteobacteria bacterium]
MATDQVYALADAEDDYFGNGGDVYGLIPISETTGVRDESLETLWFSEPIYLMLGSQIFAGYNRMLFQERVTGSTYMVDLLSGEVQQLDDALDRTLPSANPVLWGVLQTSVDNVQTITYRSPLGTLESQSMNVEHSLNVTESTAVLGNSGSLNVDETNNRWFYYYEGNGSFGSGDAVFGYADATVSIVAMTPVLTASPSALPLAGPSVVPSKMPSKNPTVDPSVGPSVDPSAVPLAVPTKMPSKNPTVD